MQNGLSAVFIVIPQDDTTTIAGFFTLSSQQITCDILPEELREKTGRYKAVGVTLLGRMAVAEEFQNRKLGRFVLFAALYEAWRATSHVGSFAVVVDAKTENVVPFYEKYGFRRLDGNRLMLPMKTIEDLVGTLVIGHRLHSLRSAHLFLSASAIRFLSFAVRVLRFDAAGRLEAGVLSCVIF